MEKTLTQLKSDNEKMANALRKIKDHLVAIEKEYDEINNMLIEDTESPVTDSDVKNLLKKYSRL